MNHTPRNVITTTRKRKDRRDIQDNSFYNHKGSFVNKKPQYQPPPVRFGGLVRPGVVEPGSVSSNRILAGYMAHEFLTEGTLFGQTFDPARAEAVPVSAAEPNRKPVEPIVVKPNKSYAEVAQLVKGEGAAHIVGVVNPTQLARWIQM